MAKNKITPTIAGILAAKIIAKIKEDNKTNAANAISKLNTDLVNDPEVQRGMKLVGELEKINKNLMKRYSSRISKDYKNSNIFSLTAEKTIREWATEYKVPGVVKVPSYETVKNDLLLAAWSGNDSDPDKLVVEYVKKYSK